MENQNSFNSGHTQNIISLSNLLILKGSILPRLRLKATKIIELK